MTKLENVVLYEKHPTPLHHDEQSPLHLYLHNNYHFDVNVDHGGAGDAHMSVDDVVLHICIHFYCYYLLQLIEIQITYACC